MGVKKNEEAPFWVGSGGEPMTSIKDFNNWKKGLYKKALKLWGVGFQIIMLGEEQAELFKAISKHLRKPQFSDHANLVDEFADVEIMQEQMLEAFCVSKEEVENKKAEKLGRLEEIIKKSTAFDKKQFRATTSSHRNNASNQGRRGRNKSRLFMMSSRRLNLLSGRREF